MRNHTRKRGEDIFRPFVVIVLFLFLVACNPSHHSTDVDTIAPDIEMPMAEDDLAVLDNSPDEDSMLIDDTAMPDKDSDGLVAACLADPEGTEYITNTHSGNEACPDLSKAAFPYYDTDGKIHFCRKCDKVWKSDPQCVRNLWNEQNCALCTAMPDYDCCGYPCTMEKLTPFYKDEREGYYLDECDMMLNPNNPPGWQTGMATFKHFNLSEGKVGMFMDTAKISIEDYANDFKAFEFDLSTRKYAAKRMGSETLSYKNGAFLTSALEVNSFKKGIVRFYLNYSSSSNTLTVAYGKPISSVSYNPIINETWAFANIVEKDGDASKMMYAKIGEWKWTSLGEGAGNEPGLVGNRLVFYTDQFKGYICNLDKAPKSLSDCKLVNQGTDGAMNLVLDTANVNVLYYADGYKTKDSLIRVDLSKEPFVYEYLKMDGLLEPLMGIYPVAAKENLLVYNNNFYTNEAKDNWDIRSCYYRVDLKRSYCSLPTPHQDGNLQYRQSASEFEGHWLVWQDAQSPLMKARDMECYCDRHVDLCPFDDYTPQPDNPKDVKTGERPNGKKR
ncbi:MAG TPA: hypothetical protein PLV42_12860 [bacterium]|nr:hypothetical protein [bacterium]